MHKLKNIVCLLGLLLASVCAHATDYYVSSDCGPGSATGCNPNLGDDSRSNAAASNPATPWKTCTGILNHYSTLPAGSRILFPRGTNTTACYMPFLANQNSTAAQPITFSTYIPSGYDYTTCTYTGQTYTACAKPKITGDGVHNVFWMWYNGGQVTNREIKGLVFEDLHITTTGGFASSAITIGPDVDDVVIQRVEAEGLGNGITLNTAADNAGHNIVLATGNGMNDRVIVRDSLMYGNKCNGLFGAANDLLIENSRFAHNGGDCGNPAYRDHNLYIGGLSINGVEQPTKRIIIRNNLLEDNTPFLTAGCEAVMLVVHGQHDGLTIDNNSLLAATPNDTGTKGGCWGIQVGSGLYANSVEGFMNVRIRNNLITNAYLGIALDLCLRCDIAYNYVYTNMVGAYGFIHFRDSSAQVHTGSPCTGVGCDDLRETDVWLRNNTLVNMQPSGGTIGVIMRLLATDVANGVTGDNYKVVGNLLYFGSGTTSATQCFNTANMPVAKLTFWDYNQCFFAGTAGKWDSERLTLGGNQAVGLDTHSKTTDPNLLTPGSPNFNPCPTAPSDAIGNGHPSQSPRYAYGGKITGVGVPRDIGACQVGSTLISPSAPTWVLP